jgi:hypothetical protein
LYYAKTGDTSYRDSAYRSYNWVTYFQGLSGGAHSPFAAQWWFTDQYSDGPRRMMDAFWAVPDWAPADESHLLGSTSVVTNVSYARGQVTYSTFDERADDVLRLDFTPEYIYADGNPLPRRNDLNAQGYVFDEKSHVLRIHHDSARNIDIQGSGGSAVPLIITFDDPHLAAATVLTGQYPSGVINWGVDQWSIHVPSGGFGTFNLALKEANPAKAHFDFYWPRIFVGIDVFNGGTQDAVLTLHCPELREVSYKINPGETRRLRTGWEDRCSTVSFEVENGEKLLFDNLAYRIE